MPESIPLRKTPNHRPGTRLDVHPHPHPHPPPSQHIDDHDSASSPVHVSALSSRQLSRDSSPFSEIPHPRHTKTRSVTFQEPESPGSDVSFDDWDDSADATMPSDLRPDVDRERDGRSLSPLLGHRKTDDEGADRPTVSRRSTHTFHERDPETQAHYETRRRYTYAAIFLALSLISFTVQTETAVYIQHELKWEKPYCML